jgi:RloB-like protein
MASKRADRRGNSPVRVGTGRETNLTRRANSREQLRSVLIVTNGKCTERQYFEAARREPWVRVGKVTVAFQAGAPHDVVAAAATKRDRDQYDECWAVCDVDEFDVSKPAQLATAHDVRLIWSNPSFEVWLILHRTDCATYFENAVKAGERLAKTVSGWKKTQLDFASFRDSVHLAVARAKKLDSPPQGNPSTDVWQLIEALMRIDDRQ